MAEKNIVVNRGIPMGGSPNTSGGSGFGHFGSGWSFLNSLDPSSSAPGSLISVSVNGATSGPKALPQNPVFVIQSSLEESLGEGNGWLVYESYVDLGLDFYDTIPWQLFEYRQELAGKFDVKRANTLAALKGELNLSAMASASIETINQALKRVQQKLAQWEDTLRASINKLLLHPAKDYLGRTISDIVTDLKKGDDYDAPAALDQELAGFKDAYAAANDLIIRDFLAEQNTNLVDSRSTQQAIAQAKRMALLSAQDQARELARQPLFDKDFLSDNEGGLHNTAYVPMENGKPFANSGITLGAGVDLGSKTSASLLADGVSAALVAKLGEYTELRGQQAVTKLAQKPLTVTESEARALSDIYLDKFSIAVERRYNNAVGPDKFRSVPYNTRTAIIDLAFQNGENLALVAPTSWGLIVSGDWKGLVRELNNYGDRHKTRRKSEAALIQQDIDMGLFR